VIGKFGIGKFGCRQARFRQARFRQALYRQARFRQARFRQALSAIPVYSGEQNLVAVTVFIQKVEFDMNKKIENNGFLRNLTLLLNHLLEFNYVYHR
jgi:hypothetical protein